VGGGYGTFGKLSAVADIAVVSGEIEAKGMEVVRVAEPRSYRGLSLNRRGLAAFLDGAPNTEYEGLSAHMHSLYRAWYGPVAHPLIVNSGKKLDRGGFRVIFATVHAMEAFVQEEGSAQLAERLSVDGTVRLQWKVRDSPRPSREERRVGQSPNPVRPSEPARHVMSYAAVAADSWEKKYLELKKSSGETIQTLQEANARLRGQLERAALVVPGVPHEQGAVHNEIPSFKERLDKMAEKLIAEGAAWRAALQDSEEVRGGIEAIRSEQEQLRRQVETDGDVVRRLQEGLYDNVAEHVDTHLEESLNRVRHDMEVAFDEIDNVRETADGAEEDVLRNRRYLQGEVPKLWAVVRTMGGEDLECAYVSKGTLSAAQREALENMQEIENNRRLRAIADENKSQQSLSEAVVPPVSGSAVGGRGTQNQPAPAGLAYPRSGAQATQSPAPEQGGWEVKESKSKKKKKKQKKSRERIAEEEAKVADKENTSHQGNAYGALSPEYREQEDAHSMSSVTSEDQEEKGGREKGRGTQFQSALADLAYHPSTPPQFLVGAGAASSDVTRDPGDDRKRGARFKGSYKL
jgi:hypothetical protein